MTHEEARIVLGEASFDIPHHAAEGIGDLGNRGRLMVVHGI
ncbi:hypothetical protein [Brachybacterium ginsengisoli]|nr:hypothetical protein [Brachybacterium ginsengisoli]